VVLGGDDDVALTAIGVRCQSTMRTVCWHLGYLIWCTMPVAVAVVDELLHLGWDSGDERLCATTSGPIDERIRISLSIREEAMVLDIIVQVFQSSIRLDYSAD